MVKESQRFNQWWIWAILCVVATVLAFAKYKTFYLQEPFGNQGPTNQLFEFKDLIIVCVLLLFVFLRLQTEADENEIRFRFLPFIFWWKRYAWEDIESIEVVRYNSLGEFLGWGIRYNFKTWAFNVSGDQGIRIRLKSGKRLLLGTQKPAEFQEHLSKLRVTPLP